MYVTEKPGGGVSPEPLGAASGGAPAGQAPPGGVLQALLALTQQDSARWNFPAAIGTPLADPGGIGNAASVTFGFATAAFPEWAISAFHVLTAGQQAGMRMAFGAWAEVADISFTETTAAAADIRIGRSNQVGSAGYAYYPSFSYNYNGQDIITSVTPVAIGGDILIANGAGQLDMSVGSFGYHTAMHEIGHAIGLKHSFETPVALPTATDNLRYSIMSYTLAPNTGVVDVTDTGGGGYYWTTRDIRPTTPMLYDIYVAQTLYGANMTTRAGNDSYAWADHAEILMTIWDGGGIDTIDASNQSFGNLINLVDGSFSSIGIRQTDAQKRVDIPGFADGAPTPDYDGRDNVAIAYGAMIENAIGGSAADTLLGNALANALTGNAGDDTLDGAAGRDTLTGGMGNDQYLIDDAGDVIVENAGEGTDTAWVNAPTATTIGANVEITRLFGAGAAVRGSGTAEQIVANPVLSSTIDGGGGDDVLWGSALANTLSGGAGDDIIRGQGGGGQFAGGAGNDQFVVANLATTLFENPGEGTDTAWVTVNGYTSGANIEIIRLAGTATNVTGSSSAEQIVANPTVGSSLSGGGGDDVLWGSTFADALNGGPGDDIIRGQGGGDVMMGGTGNDQYVVLDHAVNIIEAAGEGYDTIWYAVSGATLAANTERANLSGLANSVAGNAADNVIVGNPTLANAYLVGGGGDDTIYGGAFADLFRGDAGNDVLYSGGGADRFVYQGPGFGYDQIAGFSQGLAKIDFTGSGIGFAALFLNSAGGNTQVEVYGSAVLVFGVASLSVSDFIFG